jgi:hypothetical protein
MLTRAQYIVAMVIRTGRAAALDLRSQYLGLRMSNRQRLLGHTTQAGLHCATISEPTLLTRRTFRQLESALCTFPSVDFLPVSLAGANKSPHLTVLLRLGVVLVILLGSRRSIMSHHAAAASAPTAIMARCASGQLR